LRIPKIQYWVAPTSLLLASVLWVACGGSGTIEELPAGDSVGISDLAFKHVPTPSACGTGTDTLPIVEATASRDDGHPAEDAVDGSLSTRWECRGTGCSLTVDLGEVRQVNALDVSWYQGNRRTIPFTVSFSADGDRYTDTTSGTSSGSSSQFERYSFPTTSARYLRLTLGTDVSAVRELRMIGTVTCPDDGGTGTIDAGTPNDGGADAGTPDAGHDAGTPDAGGQEDAGTPSDAGTPVDAGTPIDAGTPDDGGTTDPGTGLDPFGVTEIYPTKPGGETWFLSSDPTHDSRFDPQDSISKNSDGSWKMKSSKVRMEVFTSTGYQPDDITTYNRETLANRGYMQSPNDWKNIEMTGFLKVNSASDMSDNFSWYSRGGRHSDDIACEGSSYKGGLTYEGRTRWEKESWHVSYDQTSYKDTTRSLKGRWVGFKAVMHNVTVSGKPAVKLELWLNDNADKVTWTKVYDYTDSGQLGGDATHCGGNVDDAIPITWGGPITTFRWDSASDVDFKWLSVRELE